MDKTTTRSTLSEAVFKNVGLSRNESSALVDSVFYIMQACHALILASVRLGAVMCASINIVSYYGYL